MNRRLLLWCFVFAIPVLGLGTSLGLQHYFNFQLRKIIREKYPDFDSEKIEKLTLNDVITPDSQEGQPLLQTQQHLQWIATASIWSGIMGAILLGGIFLAGRYAGYNRHVLLWTFAPGIYITGTVLSVLILVHGAILVASLYYAQVILLERLSIKLLGILGGAALIGWAVIVQSMWTSLKRNPLMVFGSLVTPDQAPRLWQMVADVAKKVGTEQPHHIIIGLESNFFVTDSKVRILEGLLTGRVLYCSLPLCRILTTDELASIVGHEMAHFKGEDTVFSRRFYPIYRSLINSISGMDAIERAGFSSIAALPSISILNYFLESFSFAENSISRNRELVADQEGARIASTSTFATALVKVHAFGLAWSVVEKSSRELAGKGKYFKNACKIYSEYVEDIIKDIVWDKIFKESLSHPTDSHPTLAVRLRQLGLETDAPELRIKTLPSKNLAIELFQESELLEEKLSEQLSIISQSRAPVWTESKGSGLETPTTTQNSF